MREKYMTGAPGPGLLPAAIVSFVGGVIAWVLFANFSPLVAGWTMFALSFVMSLAALSEMLVEHYEDATCELFVAAAFSAFAGVAFALARGENVATTVVMCMFSIGLLILAARNWLTKYPEPIVLD